MKQYKKLAIIIFITMLLLLVACSKNVNDDNTEKKVTEKTTSEKAAKATGGEKLIAVRAEYSFCYSTDNPDPELSRECVDNITYKECLEWKTREPGQASTFFYATFEGGEPTTVGWNANEYYMKVIYGDDLEQETGTQVAFPDMESEFMAYDLEDCYPRGTIEIYNTQDEPMGKMDFDYEN